MFSGHIPTCSCFCPGMDPQSGAGFVKMAVCPPDYDGCSRSKRAGQGLTTAVLKTSAENIGGGRFVPQKSAKPTQIRRSRRAAVGASSAQHARTSVAMVGTVDG